MEPNVKQIVKYNNDCEPSHPKRFNAGNFRDEYLRLIKIRPTQEIRVNESIPSQFTIGFPQLFHIQHIVYRLLNE